MYLNNLIKITTSLSIAFFISLSTSLCAQSPKSGDLSEVKTVTGKLGARWFINKAKGSDEISCEHPVLIAIEGGGTNTRIRITNSSATSPLPPYEHSSKSGSNLYRTAEQAIEVTQSLINEGIQTIASKMNWRAESVCYELALGMAGTEGKNNGLFLKALQNDPRMQKAVLGSDAETAWLSAFDSEGLIVIAGTGGITLGRNENGQVYRKGGFSVPMSDTPSAATHVLHYGNCINQQVSFEDDGLFIPSGVYLGYFQKLLSKSKGSGSDVFMNLHGLVTRNLTAFAAHAESLQKHFDGELMQKTYWPKNNCETLNGSEDWGNNDYCVNEAMKNSIQDLINAVSVTNPKFHNLPFAIHGTFGKVVWETAAKFANIDEAVKARKVEKDIDPLTGALKMLSDH